MLSAAARSELCVFPRRLSQAQDGGAHCTEVLFAVMDKPH